LIIFLRPKISFKFPKRKLSAPISLLALPYTILEVPRTWLAVPVIVLEPSTGATFLLVRAEVHCDFEAKRLSTADNLSLIELALKATGGDAGVVAVGVVGFVPTF
jgi:hypothetical protein